MIQVFKNVNIDWLGKRRFFIGLSILLLLAGMGTALYRHKFHPNGTEAFNLGVDFKGAPVFPWRSNHRPPGEEFRAGLNKAGTANAAFRPLLTRPGRFSF